MAPKKMRKPTQETMVEEPTPEQEVPPKSIGEEDLEAQEDHDDPTSEEEQPNIVLFTPEQLEVLLKMNRPDFNELVAALKGGSSKNAGFQPAKPGNFDGVRDALPIPKLKTTEGKGIGTRSLARSIIEG
jgi:hypothetical protein